MKLAVVGSRTFSDYSLMFETLEKIEGITAIVSGGARGADSMSANYAKKKGLQLIEFIPDWNRLGKSAGFIRNKQIVDECDKLIAFHDGLSKGTQHSIDLAKKQNKLLKIVLF